MLLPFLFARKVIYMGFYFLTEDYFKEFSDCKLIKKINRPYYVMETDKDILWAVPLSSKVSKYVRLQQEKRDKSTGHRCDTLYIASIVGDEHNRSAFLIQNMVPITREYLREPVCSLKTGEEYSLSTIDEVRINGKIRLVSKLFEKGIDLLWSDVRDISTRLNEKKRILGTYKASSGQYDDMKPSAGLVNLLQKNKRRAGLLVKYLKDTGFTKRESMSLIDEAVIRMRSSQKAYRKSIR